MQNTDVQITAPVARKDHQCSACLRAIPKGTRYWRKYSEWEDRKEHTNCAEKWPEYSQPPRHGRKT